MPDKIFIPIGNYILLENDNFSILDERSLTTQAVGYMLKNPMVHVTSIKDIKEGHSITNYVKFLTKDSLNIESRPKIITTEAFQPKIDDDSQIRVIWEELSDSRCDLKLIARGKFLLPHMSSEENDFTGSPFKKESSCDIVSICRKFCILLEGESLQGVFQLSIHSNKHRGNLESCQSQVTWKVKFKCLSRPVLSRPVLS